MASGGEPAKAIAAIRSMLRAFPMEGLAVTEPDADSPVGDFVLSEMSPLDRYQLLSVAATMVRWVAWERNMSEEAVLDAFVEENWPSSS
jgi:hypothetical protein